MKEIKSPLKSIRVNCLDCSCDSIVEVKKCHIDTCALYPYRMGKNPNRAGMGNHKGNILSTMNRGVEFGRNDKKGH